MPAVRHAHKDIINRHIDPCFAPNQPLDIGWRAHASSRIQTENTTRLTALGGLVRIRPSLGNDRFLRNPSVHVSGICQSVPNLMHPFEFGTASTLSHRV